MVVNRRVFVSKAGKTGRMAEILVEAHKRGGWAGKVRVYKATIGASFQTVVVEAEAESMASYIEAEEGFSPEMTKEEWAEWHELELSATSEMWELVYEQSSNQ